MKLSRVTLFSLLFSGFLVLFPTYLTAYDGQLRLRDSFFYVTNHERYNLLNLSLADSGVSYHLPMNEIDEPAIVTRPTDGGIQEDIPAKFQEKYKRWKDEFLSTGFGREQWENYSNNKQFILTITLANKEGQGAGTGGYKWDDTGQLVGATITLGNKMDKGLPNAIYFPVMNSLSSEEPKYKISGSLLAAAKFAHEFGHVNQTAKMNSELFRLQNKLMPLYNEILLKNGYKTDDKDLLELTKQMGGTPVEIWENREYWGETNAMLFVIDRIDKEDFSCSILGKIKRNIQTYAKEYEDRFDKIEETRKVDYSCHR